MAKQPSPDPQRMETLYERTQSDPQFFHDLVWNTEKLLPALDFLTRQEKAALLAMEPAELLQQLTAARIPVVLSTNGGDTCITNSCAATCSCMNSAAHRQVMLREEVWYSPEFLATLQRAFNKFRR